MTCKICGALIPDDDEICQNCGALISDDDNATGVQFIIGKSLDEPLHENQDIDLYDNSVSSAADKYYDANTRKKTVNRSKLAVWITSFVLILLVILSCGYILFDNMSRNTVPTVTKEDAQSILTAFNGPVLSKIKDKFRSADSDSSREAAREEAFEYFKTLVDLDTIDSVEKSADGTKIYFTRSYTECVFVMDDPTPDTYNASTVVSTEISDAFNGTYSADRDLSDFTIQNENNILILSSTDNHKSVYKELDATLYYYEDAELNVNYIENATLNNYLTGLGKYNMIFIHAQSFKWIDGKTVLALNEKATEGNIIGYSYQLANGQSAVYSSMMSDNTSFTVTDTLIKENYTSAFPNSLIYLSADYGYSESNQIFANAFISGGAQIFVGYSDSVSAVYEAKCVKDLTSYIISGKTIGDAYEFVTTKNGRSDGDETPAKFSYCGANDWSLYGWELHSGDEITQITSDQQLFDSLNYAMLALGTNSLSNNILGYRIIDADKDGAGELFMMADMDNGLTTNLAFDTLNNAKIALDTSKSEDYDFRTLYDSANSQIYLCEQFASGYEAKTLYKWTNLGWKNFAQCTDDKSGVPKYTWDSKNISKDAFNTNLKKASQGALLNNWRSMLNLYYQTADRDKTISDINSKFKQMRGNHKTVTADLDNDNKQETAIVMSGYGNEWLSNIAIMSRTGKEKILYTQHFGTFVIYIDETDVGIVLRVVYINGDVIEDFELSAGQEGGLNIYDKLALKTLNIKFNGEVSDTSGYSITEKFDDVVYSLQGTWTINGLDGTKIIFTDKYDGKIYSTNYSFADTDYKQSNFEYNFIATDNTVNIQLANGGYRTFTLQWGNDKVIALTDHTNYIQRVLTKVSNDSKPPQNPSSKPDTSSGSSSNTSSGSVSSAVSSQ